MLRSVILAASRSSRIERVLSTTPVFSSVVNRFVAGTDTADALRAAALLAEQGLAVTLDHLGEDTHTPDDAEANASAYIELLTELAKSSLTSDGAAEVSLKLSAVGQRFDPDLALAQARRICAAAESVGTTVTIDMEDHTTTDATLNTVLELRQDYPSVGVVLQAYLRRTEADCRELAVAGSRVRLCKGAYAEPESVAFQSRLDVDRSYVRCLATLMSSEAYPMVATHDPRLIAITEERAKWYEREPSTYEFQMLFGVRPEEQRRLADDGNTMRVYVPYGTQWYGYLMRRLAERPANLALLLRALRSRA